MENLIRRFGENASFLDKDKILWKIINNEWIGKRSVWTVDWEACWLEDITLEDIKSWWCGKDSDYNEIFTKLNNYK
tara:strand:+ start:455 stop:682 length:228 start_codon:yes stop_codon:yes gene_type:complete